MRIGFLITFILFQIKGNSQPLCFERTYDTLGSYYANCVKQTIDGGYITCGSAYENFTAQNAVVIKTDSLGNINWIWNYVTSGTDGATHVEELQDSTYIIYGFNTNIQGYEVFVAKLLNDGSNLWTKNYFLGSGSMFPSHLAITSDNGFVVTGKLQDGLDIIYLLKLDSNGDSLWTKYFDYLPVQQSKMIIESYDRGILIVGLGSETTGPADLDVYIIKTDSIGDTLWTKTYSRTHLINAEFGTGIIQNTDSTYFISGYSWNIINNSYDIFLLKLNQFGDTLFTKLIGDSLENTSNCIKSLNDSSIFLCGTSIVPGNSIQGYLLKLNGNGDTIWTKTFGGNAVEILFWLECTNDNGLIACGSYESANGSLFPGIYLVKTDSIGNNLIAIYEIKKYDGYFEFYPNPVHDISYLHCKHVMIGSQCEVLIYDLLGNIVQQYHWNTLNPLAFDRNDLSSGLYIINIIDKTGLIFIKKFIIN